MSYTSTPNFKVLLIGNSSVGKSSLLLRFTDDDFLSEEETTATIGVDFRTKAVEVDGQRYKLSIWDTAGQERFRTLTSSYYRGAQAVVLVYDVTARETFDELLRWLKEIDTYCAEGVVKCLVGNKIDRGFSRQVTEAEGLELAGRLGTLFVECSAKTRENVTNVFEELVREVLKRPQLYSSDVNLRKSDQAFKLSGRGAGGGEDELEDGAAGWMPGCSC